MAHDPFMDSVRKLILDKKKRVKRRINKEAEMLVPRFSIPKGYKLAKGRKKKK